VLFWCGVSGHAEDRRGDVKTGGSMFTTRYSLRSLRGDLNLFISELRRCLPGKVSMSDSKKPNALDAAKLEPKNLQANQSRLGATLLVKGEISGNEDLLIDGSVEGLVQLDEQKLMIGPTANVKADIIAREVIVRGNLNGTIRARGRIEIGNDGSVTGDLTTPQVFIEDGAWFKGSIEIEKGAGKETDKNILSEKESKSAKVTAIAAGLKST
jgi:cytoskeletal protein CcmA (bactofilin family)